MPEAKQDDSGQSMDEILASIRKIISEDEDEPETAAAEPLAERKGRPNSPAEAEADPSAAASVAAAVAAAENEEDDDDILDLGEPCPMSPLRRCRMSRQRRNRTMFLSKMKSKT